MTRTDEDAVDDLRDAFELPDPENVTRIRALVAEADAADHLNAQIMGRLMLMRGDDSRGTEWFTNFAWCDAAWSKHPDRLWDDIVTLVLLHYVIAVQLATDRVEIPLARVAQLVESMTARHEQVGRSRYLPWIEGHRVAVLRDDLAEAERLFLLSESAPDDPDVPRVEFVAIDWYARLGRDEDAVARYAAAVRGVDDATLAGGLHGSVLWPLLRLGRRADARTTLDAGLAAAARERGELEYRMPMVSAAGALGDLDRALDAVREWVVPGRDDDEPLYRSDILVTAHCVLLFEAMTAAGRGDETVPHLDPRPVSELVGVWRSDAADFAAEADAVNGDRAETAALERFWAQHPIG